MELNLENFSKIKSFNMVNMQNEELLSIGLKPTIIKLSPLYINLHKDIYYVEPIDKIYWHKECDLDRDIQNFLELMRESFENRKNLEPEKFLENYYLYKCYELRPYNNEQELTGNDIKQWLNHNANIFLEQECFYEIAGAYNKDTLELINTLLETKKEVYDGLYILFKQSNDYEKTVNDLLSFLGHFHPSFLEKSKDKIFEDDSFMMLPDVNEDKISGYAKMFLKAAQDILVRFIGIDKIESQLFKTITTSKPNIYEEYFNEIITGWNIVQLKRALFDASSQEFYWSDYNDYINLDKNREYEEEANWILKNIPYDQREKYLKY